MSRTLWRGLALVGVLLTLSACGNMPGVRPDSSPSAEASEYPNYGPPTDLVCDTEIDKLQVARAESDNSFIEVTSPSYDELTPGCAAQWVVLQEQGYTDPAKLTRYVKMCDLGDRDSPSIVNVAEFYVVMMPEAYTTDFKQCR